LKEYKILDKDILWLRGITHAMSASQSLVEQIVCY